MSQTQIGQENQSEEAAMSGKTENPYAGQGPVLLDIGGDVGALVVVMPAHTEGLEVELRPAGATAAGRTRGHDHEAHDHEPDNHDSPAHEPDNHDWPGHAHGPDQHGHGHSHEHPDPHDLDGGHLAGGPAYPHVAVVARPDGDTVVHSLVYPSVTQGAYELYPLPNGPATLTTTVTGGQVVRVSWPD